MNAAVIAGEKKAFFQNVAVGQHRRRAAIAIDRAGFNLLHFGSNGLIDALIDKQARGKKRMKRFGKGDIPSEAFTVMLKRD